MSKKIVLDTFEVVLTDVIMEEVGSSADECLAAIKEWYDEHAKSYTIKEVRFKHHGL